MIRFGRVPFGSYADMYRDHQDLLDYLKRAAGREIELKIYENYGDMVNAIRDGNLELAWLGPLAYLQAEDAVAGLAKLRVWPIVKPRRFGRSEYVAEIIIRKDSGIDTIADLKGRTMAFVDTESTAGYLLAAAHLVKFGISERDPLLTRRQFVNQYGNVVLSVLFGKYDAGAVFGGAPALFLKGSDKGRQAELRVLTRTEPVPYEPIAAVVGGQLTDSEALGLQKLFLNLSDTVLLKKLQVDGFVEATAAEYKPIRKIVQAVDRIHQAR